LCELAGAFRVFCEQMPEDVFPGGTELLASCEQSFTSKTKGADVRCFGEIDDELG
jgi:hypothetical protein